MSVQRCVLSWTVLALLLSAGTSQPDVDVQWLTKTVEIIRTRYTERGQFCAAVKIPEDLMKQQNPDFEELLSRDTNEDMQESFKETEKFYDGHLVVAAKPVQQQQYTEHAEYSVLKHINKWSNERTNNFLLIYTYLSPCSGRCANKDDDKNILESIGFMTSWVKGYALVFQLPYSQPRTDSENRSSIPKDDLKAALTAIAEVIGAKHIFRCYKPEHGPFQCIRCFSETNDIVDECYEERPSAKRAHSPDSGSDAKKRHS